MSEDTKYENEEEEEVHYNNSFWTLAIRDQTEKSKTRKSV
jgi:hypothetical protein